MSNKVLLIGVDGATFSILDRFLADGTMPFLAEFLATGVRADLRTIIPALTPPAWTSLQTGRLPGKHGIFDFFRKETPDSQHIRFLSGKDIASDTIARYVNKFGLRATVLNYPVSYPSPRIDGYIIPGWMPWKQLPLACQPPDLYGKLKGIPDFNPRELAMDMRQEEKAIEGCSEDQYVAWIDLHIRKERQWLRIVRWFYEQDPSDYTTVLLDGADKIQHLLWRFIAPDCSDGWQGSAESEMRGHCQRYFHGLDEVLKGIVAAADKDTTVILASDHGFQTQRSTFYVNSWLESRGWLHWAREAPRESEQAVLGIAQLAKHVYMLDWEKTKAYAPTPSSNGIHIVRRSDRNPHGVPAEEYETFRKKLIDGLKEVSDPVSRKPLVEQVWKREEIFAGRFQELAPDLTLVLRDGGLISILASDAPAKPRAVPCGTHHPLGIFAARGPGLKRGLVLQEMSILDVAPLIVHSLGLPVPEDYDGVLPLRAFEDAPAAAPKASAPIETTPDTAAPGSPHKPEMDAEAEAEIMRRLTALGYFE
jgi:predicted AlkP superfamily phosphohydrolase/phosphomutase